jgi:hypothetical protein
MQYLLTPEEYLSLNRKSKELNDEAKKTIQTLCTMVADNMPVVNECLVDKTPKPWRCILTEGHEWYCDGCPVRTLCPYEHKNYHG